MTHEHATSDDGLLAMLERLSPEDRETLRLIAARFLRDSETDQAADEPEAESTRRRSTKRTLRFAGMIDGPSDLSATYREVLRRELGGTPE